MKSYKLLIPFLVITAVTQISCKHYLDQPLLGNTVASNYFTSDANAQNAINTAYIPLLFTAPASNAVWVLGDVASDDAVKGGNPGDQADFESVDQFNIIPSNSAIEGVWKKYYDGVFKCNVVITGLADDNTAVSESVKTSAVAQAKFLRAYYYFILTTCYGNIPLHLKVETPEEVQSPALPQAQIYAQIETDCKDAAAVLPTSWGSDDAGRGTKGAALALLAKTYLFEQKWSDAAATAKQVEAVGIYSLTKLFTDNFNANTKDNKEAIFSVWHKSGASPFLGNNLNQWFAPRDNIFNGYGFFYPTQSLIDNFEKTPSGIRDPRFGYTLSGPDATDYYDTTFQPAWAITGSYITKKQIQPLSEIPNSIKGDGNLNYEAIRFADVLLIEAEALNEQGKGAEALAPLNAVRKRARESFLYDATLPGFGTVPDGLLPDIITTNQTQLRDAIRKERRSELALEFHRFFDMIRYGKEYAASAMQNVPNFNYDNDKFFPIPQSERDTNHKL